MLDNYIIGKYLRLSLEDSKTDSLSLENQRIMIDKHIAGMNIPGAEVLEFVDNGHSGTNFERPAIQELLELARQGLVNCIIVKDLSRFGRNMIETGYYIERIFPLYRVRFIALSDSFDSEKHEGGTGGVEVAFKFLAAEQYSRDLSRKILSAKRARAEKGEYIMSFYGYNKIDNRLHIDEAAAENVRLIFELFHSGLSVVEIENIFYAEKRPTPAEHRNRTSTPSCNWHNSGIREILRNEQYIGTYIAGKTKRVEIGRSKSIPLPESEWIKIPNHHPAIVDKDLFESVRQKLNQKNEHIKKRKIGTSNRYKNISSSLKGKVVCGCCNRKMSLSCTQNASFRCNFTRAALDASCHKHSVLAKELEIVVLNHIREHVSATSTPNTGCLEVGNKKIALYESFALGVICESEYLIEKTALEQTYGNSAVNLPVSTPLRLEDLKELTSAVVDSIIERVIVFPGGEVEVMFKTN